MEPRKSDIDQYAGYVYKFILQYVKMTEAEFNRFLPFFELRYFSKKEVVLRYGQIDNYLNLVVKGLIRKYVLAGKEQKTLQLATEGHIIQSELSFHKREPSTMVIETIEPSVVVSMKYENVQHVLENIPQAEQIGRQMMTSLFVRKDAKYFSKLNTTTRQRFLHYMQQHPHMLQRVPQKILASYLEIQPETFSRLKHLLKS